MLRIVSKDQDDFRDPHPNDGLDDVVVQCRLDGVPALPVFPVCPVLYAAVPEARVQVVAAKQVSAVHGPRVLPVFRDDGGEHDCWRAGAVSPDLAIHARRQEDGCW